MKIKKHLTLLMICLLGSLTFGFANNRLSHFSFGYAIASGYSQNILRSYDSLRISDFTLQPSLKVSYKAHHHSKQDILFEYQLGKRFQNRHPEYQKIHQYAHLRFYRQISSLISLSASNTFINRQYETLNQLDYWKNTAEGFVTIDFPTPGKLNAGYLRRNKQYFNGVDGNEYIGNMIYAIYQHPFKDLSEIFLRMEYLHHNGTLYPVMLQLPLNQSPVGERYSAEIGGDHVIPGKGMIRFILRYEDDTSIEGDSHDDDEQDGDDEVADPLGDEIDFNYRKAQCSLHFTYKICHSTALLVDGMVHLQHFKQQQIINSNIMRLDKAVYLGAGINQKIFYDLTLSLKYVYEKNATQVARFKYDNNQVFLEIHQDF